MVSEEGSKEDTPPKVPGGVGLDHGVHVSDSEKKIFQERELCEKEEAGRFRDFGTQRSPAVTEA